MWQYFYRLWLLQAHLCELRSNCLLANASGRTLTHPTPDCVQFPVCMSCTATLNARYTEMSLSLRRQLHGQEIVLPATSEGDLLH